MRIAFLDYVCDPDKPGTTGLSDLVWDMAGRLVRCGHEVHVVAPYTVDTVPHPGVIVHRFALPPIGYRNIIGHGLIIWRAIATLRRIGPVDVVHVPEYLSSALLTTLYRRAPVVVTEPGNVFERIENGNPYDPVTTQVLKLAAIVTARTCAHLVATSSLMCEWWVRTGVSPDRVSLIPLGVDTRLFQRDEVARQVLGITPDQPTLVYAARLSRENGAALLLRAVALLRPAWPALQVHMLGRGPEQDRLHALAVTLGIADSIRWHGWVPFHFLPRFYSAATVFVFSGYSGGTPRVMLQAMACGAPVVAAAIGGITDHIAHGESGLLFVPGDVDSLVAALQHMLARPSEAAEMAHRSYQYVRTTVDWDVIINRLQTVYAHVTDAQARKVVA